MAEYSIKQDAVTHAAAITKAFAQGPNATPDTIAEVFRRTRNDIELSLTQADRDTMPVCDPNQRPAVAVKKSVTPDHLVCLECGKKMKVLKRHLTTAHGLTVDEYRSKWSLPADYPVVAPNYAKARSKLAINLGLGRKAS